MSNDKIKKKVYLSPEQRKNLESVSRNGHSPAKKILHARVLLMADQYHPKGGKTDMQISEALGMHVNTVGRIRRSFVFEGEESALERKKREFPPVRAKLDGEKEAHLVALCCSQPPKGRVRWTLSLLVDEMTTRGIVTKISRETVRKALKKTNCDLGKSNATVSRRKIDPAL